MAPVIHLPGFPWLSVLVGAGALAALLVGVAAGYLARRDGVTTRHIVAMVGGVMAAIALLTGSIAILHGASQKRADLIVKGAEDAFGVVLTGDVPDGFGDDTLEWDTIGSRPGLGGQRCTLSDTDTSQDTATLKLVCDTMEVAPKHG